MIPTLTKYRADGEQQIIAFNYFNRHSLILLMHGDATGWS